MNPGSFRPTRANAAIVAGVLGLALCSRVAHAEPDDQVALDGAYKRLLERPHPRYLLPAVELFVAMSTGFTWYWLDRERQVADWDFPSIKQRFTGDAWKFDTNPFPINWAWHAYDGGQYHLFARANDLDLWTAAAYGLVMSVMWEFTVEFREQVSINDVIWTTATGVGIGEFLHWLGRYMESAPQPRWWHPIAGWTLTTSRTGHNAIFKRDRLRRGTTPDHLGFSSDIWHRFVLSAGVAHTQITGDVSTTREGKLPTSLGRVVATGELAAIPGYLTASSLERNFSQANVSSARLRLDGGDDSFALDFGVDTFLIGHHRQHLPAEGAGRATTIGANIAFRYRRELFGPYVQRLAQTHLPSVGIDHHIRLGDFWLRGRARANYDFVGVHALAYSTWRATQPVDIIETSVVRKHKYYFGWGPSTRLDLELALPTIASTGSLAAGTSLGLARYHSQRGYDRENDILTHDLDMNDRLVDWNAWLRFGSRNRRTFLEGRVEQHRRTNTVEDVTQSTQLTAFLLSFGTEQ